MATAPNPTPPTRVEHLLEAARAAFSAHGFEHVSIDAIARIAGVSKETIYRHFPDKAALFEAAIEGLSAAFSAQVTRTANLPANEQTVTDFARAIYDTAISGGYLSATWLAITSVRSFPDVAERLNAEGLRRMEPIRAALAARTAAGGVAGRVTMEHAGDLGAMAVEGSRHIMGWSPLEGEARERHVRAVAHLFLHGCGTCAAPSPNPAPVERPFLHIPRPEPREDHIVKLMETAGRHFHAQGYRGASLDVIGAEARVGRGTLYRHFAGKAGLFEAVMLGEAHAIAAKLAAKLPDLPPAANPAAALHAFARIAGDVLAGPGSIALHRIVIAEARRAPELARQVHTTARLTAMLPLTEYLAAGAAAGRFGLGDAEWHACQFLTLAGEGNRPLTRVALASPEDRARTADRAVATFLHGFGAALMAES